tara:strand:- start:13410 stop:14327 length:918 start_codon:yes stop_codon:yes gene_type:complete
MQSDFLKQNITFNHISVMPEEIINMISKIPMELIDNGIGIDATIGGGGHSYKLLNKFKSLKIIGIDQDPFARKHSQALLEKHNKRVEIIDCNFCDFTPTEKVAFVLADLGVNSYQFDNSNRGFSLKSNGPLDMRMNPTNDLTAEKLINKLSEKELANLIYEYGEERFSRRIANRIKFDIKKKGKFNGTTDLAKSIASCFPKKLRFSKIHPATRTFQALRIAVNNEIISLKKFLHISPNWIHSQGMISIISFHSLEDREVKNSFKEDKRLNVLTKKPIRPTEEEILRNSRSRSGKLRIAIRNGNEI